jgi:hypothetical protein
LFRSHSLQQQNNLCVKCYGLDILKGHMLKPWSPACGALGRHQWNFRRGRKSGHWGCVFERPCPLLTSLFLLPSWGELVSSTTCNLPWSSGFTYAQTNGMNRSQTETYETINQNKPFFLLSQIYQVFCNSDGILTNIPK